MSTAMRFESSSAHVATASARASSSTAEKAERAEKQRSIYASMSNEEIVGLLDSGKLRFFNLEVDLGDLDRAVVVRRLYLERKTKHNIGGLPHENYNWQAVQGQCCENVIGYVPIPVGVAGPITVDSAEYYLPMATTEGALVASTTRGCKAISMSGVYSVQ